MYNHYIPQSDGSYRRSTMPENNRRSQNQNNLSKAPQRGQPAQPPVPNPCPQPVQSTDPSPCGESALAFLRNLLPQQIDATDLLVILLILLMNKDDDPQGFSPLLTLALYFLL